MQCAMAPPSLQDGIDSMPACAHARSEAVSTPRFGCCHGPMAARTRRCRIDLFGALSCQMHRRTRDEEEGSIVRMAVSFCICAAKAQRIGSLGTCALGAWPGTRSTKVADALRPSTRRRVRWGVGGGGATLHIPLRQLCGGSLDSLARILISPVARLQPSRVRHRPTARASPLGGTPSKRK